MLNYGSGSGDPINYVSGPDPDTKQDIFVAIEKNVVK
jgi:hypothetical protein